MSDIPGFPPKGVAVQLRLEGLFALAAAVTAYWFIGGNWWLFAVLLFAPDLAILSYSAGEKTGARIYNFMHTYTHPIIVGGIGWFAGWPVLVEIGLIWATHIAMDRALGYGLKYPGSFKHTHLGRVGKDKTHANAS